ncbi:MAG TPA: GWxTD domain-containing protein [Bacteroidales bacterium]|nr:GWxTD domain-containing protein [Bacteroidales bacterium]
MRPFKYIYIISALALFLNSCATVNEIYDPNDLSYLYNPLKNPIHPGYHIFNTSGDISILSIRFFSNELFFSEANPEGVPKAQLVVIYRIFNMSLGRVPIDTGIINITIRKEPDRRYYSYNFPLKSQWGSKYEAELVVRDVIRNLRVQAHLPFDKTSEINRYSFKVLGHFDKEEVFSPVLHEHEFVNILYPRENIDTIFLKYYEPFDIIPIPPSMLLPEMEIDTRPVNTVSIPYSDTLPVMFPERGVYHFTLDTNSLEGFTFFNFGSDYPGMRNPEPMIEPLIYLINEEDMNELRSNPYPKMALDDFWLKITGNIERSRELIRIYYNRVLYANYFFSSYKEGWRTDRGMIYIIYGPPDKVYKTADGERWGYRKAEVRSGWGTRYKVDDDYLYFTFRKRENPFSDQNYTLLRSETITTYWEVAIRTWRSGVVFRLDNPLDI